MLKLLIVVVIVITANTKMLNLKNTTMDFITIESANYENASSNESYIFIDKIQILSIVTHSNTNSNKFI